MAALRVKNFLLLTAAGVINAFGVTIFLAPVQLYDSGISGTSMLLSQLTPEWMGLPLFLLALNIPLFIFGLKKLGAVFTVYSIIVEGVDRSKSVFVISSKDKEICRALSQAFEQGMTLVDAQGYYSGSNKKMIFIFLNRFQITSMGDLVYAIDPRAYISISEVADVYKKENTEK